MFKIDVMRKYIKNGDVRSRQEIVVVKDGMQVINPSEEMLLNDGWEIYVAPMPSEDTLLAEAKIKKRIAAEAYGSSSEVDCFYMRGQKMWLDFNLRSKLYNRLQAEMALGKDATTLWYGNQSFDLPIADAMRMLYALEVYASRCYDNTQRHLVNIQSLQTSEDIRAYDYKEGYPVKLEF